MPEPSIYDWQRQAGASLERSRRRRRMPRPREPRPMAVALVGFPLGVLVAAVAIDLIWRWAGWL